MKKNNRYRAHPQGGAGDPAGRRRGRRPRGARERRRSGSPGCTRELLGGTFEDPHVHLQSVFTEKYDEIVLLRDIPFYSICEHHLLPFIGKAHVAYLPTGKVLGVSKLARIVDSFAHRLQAQERLTGQIADFLMENLKPLGVAVVLQASHSCMTIRGIRKPGSMMVTSALRGIFKKDARSRSEVLSLMHNDKG